MVSFAGAPPATPQVDLDGLLSNLLAKGLIGQTPASSAPPVSAPAQPQGIQSIEGGPPGPGQGKPAFNALVSMTYSYFTK